jgi:hypothetical protein
LSKQRGAAAPCGGCVAMRCRRALFVIVRHARGQQVHEIMYTQHDTPARKPSQLSIIRLSARGHKRATRNSRTMRASCGCLCCARATLSLRRAPLACATSRFYAGSIHHWSSARGPNDTSPPCPSPGGEGSTATASGQRPDVMHGCFALLSAWRGARG